MRHQTPGPPMMMSGPIWHTHLWPLAPMLPGLADMKRPSRLGHKAPKARYTSKKRKSVSTSESDSSETRRETKEKRKDKKKKKKRYKEPSKTSDSESRSGARKKKTANSSQERIRCCGDPSSSPQLHSKRVTDSSAQAQPDAQLEACAALAPASKEQFMKVSGCPEYPASKTSNESIDCPARDHDEVQDNSSMPIEFGQVGEHATAKPAADQDMSSKALHSSNASRKSALREEVRSLRRDLQEAQTAAQSLQVHVQQNREGSAMRLEDCLSHGIREVANLRQCVIELQAAVDAARARASSAVESAKAARGKLQKFAVAAGNIKQGAARRLERRDVKIRGLQAEIGTRDVQIRALLQAREALLGTVSRLKDDADTQACADGVPSGGTRLDNTVTDTIASSKEISDTESETDVLPHKEVCTQQPALKQRGMLAAPRIHGRVAFAAEDKLTQVRPIVSHRGGSLWFVKPGTLAVCDACDRKMPTSQGALFSDPSRSQFMQDKFYCRECAGPVIIPIQDPKGIPQSVAPQCGSHDVCGPVTQLAGHGLVGMHPGAAANAAAAAVAAAG